MTRRRASLDSAQDARPELVEGRAKPAGRGWQLCAVVAVYSFAILFAFELAGRVTYFKRHGMPLWSPACDLAYRYYPNVRDVLNAPPRDDVRVLILGGSTLNAGLCDVGVRLQRGLGELLGRKIQLFNLAMPAQGSLDTYYKYWLLRDEPFDLVVLYDGINELRANAVPDDVWQDDYSHYAWYADVNFYFRHEALARYGLILPYYLYHKAVYLDKALHHDHRVPYNSAHIRPDWMHFGSRIRSAKPFRANLERTIALATRKHEPVLLMTFAYSIPPDYSRERFEQGQLGYDRSRPGHPVELWGLPEHVAKGLQVHNEILRAIAAAHQLLFVDEETLMGHDPRLFIDVCHLSPSGSARFADHVMAELRRRRFRVERQRGLN